MNDTPSTMPLPVRMRRSPCRARSLAAGALGRLVDNNMLIATHFAGSEEGSRHLKTAVQVWDVGCERHVEIISNQIAGRISSSCKSCDFECHAAICLINAPHRAPGPHLQVHTAMGAREGVVKDEFWGRT